MLDLSLSQHRRARVWLMEQLPARLVDGTPLERVVPGGAKAEESIRMAAVEILIPKGGHALYGLLGAEITPASNRQILIRVTTSGDCEPPFHDSIAFAFEDARIGLPAEYAESVFRGALRTCAQIGKPFMGNLDFNCAAHGSVGSCSLIFEWLAAVVTSILSGSEQGSREEALIELLSAPLEV